MDLIKTILLSAGSGPTLYGSPKFSLIKNYFGFHGAQIDKN
jgi:hypothetical protein